MIEENNEIILKKESEILKEMDGEEQFWKSLTRESMKRAWNKEDEIWDKLYKEQK